AAGGAACAAAVSATTASVTRLEAEDIHRAPGRRLLLDLLLRADDAQRRVGVVGRDVGERHRAHPAADTRVDGHVLLAVWAAVGNRIADDARRAVELPQLIAGARVDRLEPAVHRAVEHDVAGGGEHAAVERELQVFHAPRLAVVRHVPRHELTVITARPLVHL